MSERRHRRREAAGRWGSDGCVHAWCQVAHEAGTHDIEAWQAKILELSQSARQVEVQQGTRTEEEAALERAEHLMNAVCLGHYASWDEVRGQLADIYTQGSRHDLAAFVTAC